MRAFHLVDTRPVRGAMMLAVLVGILLSVVVTPGTRADTRIYLANDIHSDILWSAGEEEYAQAFLSMLDYYMDQAEATATNPPDSRGKFNCDGTYWAWTYQQRRSAPEFARLMQHVRDGNITLPLETLPLLQGAMPVEALIRNMYYAGRLERREALDLPIVMPIENQTLPGGVASVWAGSGATYAWKGICGCASQTAWGNRPREIYHFEGPDGASVCMKWNTMRSGNQGMGGYAEARFPYDIVDYIETDSAFLSSWPWPVSAAFGHGWDDVATETDIFIDASLDLSTAERRVIVSNEIDFFEDFLANHSNEIPTFSGSFGNEWEMLTATLGAVTADFKRHVEKLRTAEAMAAVVSLYDPTFMDGREAERDLAFVDCGLFYEHGWSADGSVPASAREAFQRRVRDEFAAYVNTLYDDALLALGDLVRSDGQTERHLVFNPLSWTRTDYADLQVEQPAPFFVRDEATGDEVPSQAITIRGADYVRILARDVPSVGYKVYEIVPGEGENFGDAAVVTLPVFDNGVYEVGVGSSGDIISLVDHKDGDRQLVGGVGASILDLGTGSGPVEVSSTGPVSATLRVVAVGSPDHETLVTLYHPDIDRIDVEGMITENFGNSTVGYSSRFALSNVAIHHEEVGMVARVARNAAGGDYADENARTDYLTLNHFVDYSESGRGVTVSSWDSHLFRTGNSTTSFLDDATPAMFAVVGMRLTSAGLQNQGGDTEFLNRFSLRTHGAYDQAAAMRFSLEHQNPLVSTRVTGQPSSALPSISSSFMRVNTDDVLLWAFKPAEDGNASGVIARIWNLADTNQPYTVQLPQFLIADAMRATHIETDIGPAGGDPFGVVGFASAQEMLTFRLVPGAAVAVGPVATAPPSARADLRVLRSPVSAGAPARVSYFLPRADAVRLTVYDVAGRLVAVLADGRQAEGWHTATWSDQDRRSRKSASGTYFVRLASGDQVVAKKLLLIR